MRRARVRDSDGSECTWSGVIYNVTTNTVITLYRNFRGQAISKDLGLLSNPVVADFGYTDNELSGSIPSEWKAWTNFHTFKLYDDSLFGPIPPDLRAWTNIVEFYVPTNDLLGTIPSELEAWTNIQRFIVYRNQLTGSIPSALKECTNIQDFVTFDNPLTGSIPAELGAWTKIQKFNVEGNQTHWTHSHLRWKLDQLTIFVIVWQLLYQTPEYILRLSFKFYREHTCI